MKVIIFYEHISREGDEVKKITSCLRDKGAEANAFSVIFEYYKAVKFAKKNGCDVIVMPWAYSEKYYSMTAPFVEVNPDIIIISLNHEEIGSEYSLPALCPRGKHAKENVIHFAWGEYFAGLLADVGVKKDNIVVAGNGRTDFINKEPFSRDKIAKQYSLDLNKRWLLFAESRGFVYTKQKRTIDEHARRGIPAEETKAFYDFTLKSIEASREDFNNLSNEFFESYELIYRPHPGTVAMNDIDSRIKIISEYSIYDWLKLVDANIVWSSTTIFESDFMGVPSIVYEPIENKQKYRTFGTETYYKIKSLNEITEGTIKKARAVQEKEKAYLNYYGIIDGHRCENIAEEIINSVMRKPCDYKAEISEMDRTARLAVFEFITRVFTKIGLIKLLKWPTTAYDRFNDIPWIVDEDLEQLSK